MGAVVDISTRNPVYSSLDGSVVDMSTGVVFETIDADAAAFFTAAGITDATQKSAVNTLVTSLKSNSLWTKFNALYPFVGGSATSHKFNLINPADSNAAFRLSFMGGWTHSANGALPNGTTGYADTFLNVNTTLSLNDAALHIYNGTNTATNCIDIGAEVGANVTEVYARYTNTFYTFINNSSSLCQVANNDSRGFYTSTRTASNLIKCIKNGTEQTVISNTVASTSKPKATIFIGAANNGSSAILFADRSIRFAGVSSGFTAAEAATLYTIIQAYQTSLSRNV